MTTEEIIREKSFLLVDTLDRQNVRIRSRRNLQFLIEAGTQYQAKVNIWVGMNRPIFHNREPQQCELSRTASKENFFRY